MQWSKAVETRHVRIILYLSALVPLGLLYYLSFSHVVNIPFIDDYDIILGSVLDFQDSHTAGEKISILFAQHNEHRPAFARISAVVFYHLAGEVDFNALVYFGDVGLIGLIAVLYLLSAKGRDRLLYLVPVSFILFHPQNWENTQWASSAIPVLGAMVFSLLSICMAAIRQRPYFVISVFGAIAAAFSHAAGLFVLPVCLLILAYQKRNNEMLLLLAVTAAILTFYFADYHRPGHHPPVINAVLSDPVNTLRFFFALLGAPVTVPGTIYVSLAAGVASLSLMMFLTAKRYYARNIRIYAALVFLFTVVLAITLARSGFGVEQAFSSRYRIISLLIIALECIALLEYMGAKAASRFLPVLLALSVLFNAGAFFTQCKYVNRHRSALAEGALEYGKNGTVPVGEDDADFVRDILVRAKEKGIYDFPASDEIYRWVERENGKTRKIHPHQ